MNFVYLTFLYFEILFISVETTVSQYEGLKRPTEEEEVDEEEVEEHDEKDSEALSDDCTASVEKKRSRPVYTGRGVTLNMLMNEHLIEPGKLCMSIEYLVSVALSL